MFGTHRRLAPAALASMTLVAAAGCSASVPAGGVTPAWPAGGASNALTIGVPEDMALPDGFVEAVYQGSEVRLNPVSLDLAQFAAVSQKGSAKDLDANGMVALLGVDRDSALRSESGGGGATEYGEDDICELIDKSWFAANKLPVPSNDELAEMDIEDQPQGVIWGSVLLTIRGMNNVGTDARWIDVPGSCVPTTRNLLPLDGAEKSSTLQKFSRFLVSKPGQDAIAKYGLAFPKGTPSGGTIEVQLPLAQAPIVAQRP